ncbi:hypothetical protein ERO13_A12G196000v2 [Gossypium hirsutum]|nr:probable transcription factor At5g61620 [Gossypium hirsutum]KAG4171219.1 hypothetical protein ERO13_A12G196000v2 [Gossypium hirsutum]TYG90962.1 hypothetical protein ES288_A12G225300v1 [Gossypium darwinii]TYJ06100.1 hypothetical protein E1A91_A12G210300v1 [Gossypium mustelinum]
MMAKGTGRKCSHCGHNGHNSRTCSNGKRGYVKLFGVNIAAMAQTQECLMQRSFSMGNLPFHAENHNNGGGVDDGYFSEGHIHSENHNAAAHDIKRAKPWTEEEHRMFLEGLRKLGKGDWRGISKNYVISRTPVQVASHAQKYFLRLQDAGNNRKKRRPSLFDMSFQESKSESNECPWGSPSKEPSTRDSSQIVNRLPHLCSDDRSLMSMIALPSSPTYNQTIQHMAEVTPNMMQSLPFLNAKNYTGYCHDYFSKAVANVDVCVPSDHPSPRSVQDNMFTADPGASSSTDDLLELKVAAPQSSKSTTLPFIRVIRNTHNFH